MTEQEKNQNAQETRATEEKRPRIKPRDLDPEGKGYEGGQSEADRFAEEERQVKIREGR